MTSPNTLSNPSSVGLPDILDPSDTIFHLNQLKQNLYFFLRAVENDLSAEEAVDQSKIVLDSLVSFKEEALLLPVVKESREFQKRRVSQLLNEIKLKNDFYNSITSKRPLTKSKNDAKEKKKKANNWIQDTVMRAKRKRQLDIFQGRLLKAPKTSEDEREDGLEYSAIPREKVLFNKGTKVPRIWRLKKERSKIKEIQGPEDKVISLENKEENEIAPGPSEVRGKDEQNTGEKSTKSAAEIYQTELAPIFEKLNSSAVSQRYSAAVQKYSKLGKVRRTLLLHREKFLNADNPPESSSKKRKFSGEDFEIEKQEVIKVASKKWKYYRPSISKTTSQSTVKSVPEVEEGIFQQNFPALTNTQINLMRTMKVVESESAGKTESIGKSRCTMAAVDVNGDSGDLATTIEEPIDFIRFALNEHVLVKMRTDRALTGILQSFDQHLNMVMSDVVETINTTELDLDSGEEIVKTVTREIPLLFIRGDSVVLVSTPNRNVT